MKRKTIRLLLILSVSLFTSVAFSQTKKLITGTIKDSTGKPLAGATVKVKGGQKASASDANGNFKIEAATSDDLVVSSVGFEQKEVHVGEQSQLLVTLSAAIASLDNVIVTSLGISKQQKALGYATTTIKADQITQAGSPNFATALYGKAPGVRISATPGGPTSAVNITIRGLNSITGKTQPLIVLDGIPIRDGEVKNNDYWNDQRLRGNGLLDINPEDIDNISVLKGASAAALYGSEAVNGVLLITTKNGKGKKGFTVDFNASYGIDDVAFLPRYQHVRGAGLPLNVANDGQDDAGFIYQDVNGQTIRSLTNRTVNFGPKFDGDPILAWDGQIRPYVDQGDNYAGLFQTAQNSNVNIALTQSTDVSSTRLSYTHQEYEGISIGSKNKKNIVNINSTHRLGKKVSVDVMANFINQYTHNRPYSVDRMMNNFSGMMGRFDNADWYLAKYKTSAGYKYVTGTNQSLTPDENIIYPGFRSDIADYVWNVKEQNSDENSNRLIGSITGNWQIVKELKLRGRISTDYTSMKTENKSTSEIPLAFGYSGSYGLSTYLDNILYGDLLLTYTKKINSNLELNVMGGYTASQENNTIENISTNGGLSTENKFDIAASVNTPNASTSRFTLVKDAFLGTVNAGYKNYLFVEGTVRRDRTSTMNPHNNSFVYPSVNSSFVISEAFKLPEAINYAKVRASWGIVGNYPELYAANIAYNQNTLGVQQSGGQPVLYTTLPSTFGNDGIKPETKHEIEFGLETKFLKGRLNFDISYYNAQIKDQILPLTIPSTSGATSVLTNIGTLRNKGIEVAINGTPVATKNFKWNIGVNAAQNSNVVEKLATGSNELLHADYDGNAAQLKSVVGQPMGDFYAHPVLKNDKGQMVVGPDGLYALDPNNMIKVGNSMPKAVGGISNTLTYKSFALDVIADFRIGGYVMPTGINWMISRGILDQSLQNMDAEHGGIAYYVDPSTGKGVQTTGSAGPNGEKVYNDGMLLDGYTADGNKNDNVVSQAYYFWNVYNWGGPQYSESRYELYIVKNSYVKLREVSLSYTLPTSIANKISAKRIQLSVYGRNLFYFYRTIKDMDAEQTTAGSRWYQTLTNAGTNPATRSYGIMIRTTF